MSDERVRRNRSGLRDVSKFTTIVVITPVLQQVPWNIIIDGASMDGKTIENTGGESFVDTGTPWISVAYTAAEAIHASIPGATQTNPKTDKSSY